MWCCKDLTHEMYNICTFHPQNSKIMLQICSISALSHISNPECCRPGPDYKQEVWPHPVLWSGFSTSVHLCHAGLMWTNSWTDLLLDLDSTQASVSCKVCVCVFSLRNTKRPAICWHCGLVTRSNPLHWWCMHVHVGLCTWGYAGECVYFKALKRRS